MESNATKNINFLFEAGFCQTDILNVYQEGVCPMRFRIKMNILIVLFFVAFDSTIDNALVIVSEVLKVPSNTVHKSKC